jgi:hypothetical protein
MTPLRFLAAAATALMGLMNLPIALDAGGADIPTTVAWLISALGAIGIATAVALLFKARWATWTAVAVGAVNVVGAVIALTVGSDGAIIGLIVSTVSTAVSLAYARLQGARQPQAA